MDCRLLDANPFSELMVPRYWLNTQVKNVNSNGN